VNERYLDKSFVGRVIDQSFIDDLPDNVDVCAKTENFTLLLLTDLFSNPILLRKVKLFIANMKKPTNSSTNTACDTDATDAYDYGFYYCDLLPL
jgi:hypothetical protein